MDKIARLKEEINIIYREIGSSNKSLNVKEILNLYYRYLKLLVQIQSPIPDTKFDYRLVNGNCYFYAFGLPMPNIFKQAYENKCKEPFRIDVGEMSGYINYLFSEKILLEQLYGDLEFLNIKCYESDYNKNPSHNGYNIAIFIDEETPDYHFVRQNEDGSWSQKIGYDDNIIIIDNNPFNYIYENIEMSDYVYLKTIEIVKPTLRRLP